MDLHPFLLIIHTSFSSSFVLGFTMLINFGFIFGYGITLFTCWNGPFFIKKPII